MKTEDYLLIVGIGALGYASYKMFGKADKVFNTTKETVDKVYKEVVVQQGLGTSRQTIREAVTTRNDARFASKSSCCFKISFRCCFKRRIRKECALSKSSKT